MADHLIKAAIIVSLVSALLLAHIMLSLIVARHFARRISLLLLAGLSVMTSITWNLGGLVTTILFLVNPDAYGTLEYYVSSYTFGLTGDLCELFPQLAPPLGINLCYHVSPLVVGAVLFFLLSLLPAVLVTRKLQLKG